MLVEDACHHLLFNASDKAQYSRFFVGPKSASLRLLFRHYMISL